MILEKLMNNFHVIRINNRELYFSYETLIAFRKDEELFICENIWGTTTGKHLNYINNDKKRRLNHDDFLKKAKEVL